MSASDAASAGLRTPSERDGLSARRAEAAAWPQELFIFTSGSQECLIRQLQDVQHHLAAAPTYLRETAFTDEKSFFHRFAQMSQEEAEKFGLWAWEEINLPNLLENSQPTRGRADLVRRKGKAHAVEVVELRKG